jgi:fatty acid hydroxylase domain-containing protein 2
MISITFSCGAYFLMKSAIGDIPIKEQIPCFFILLRDLVISYEMFDVGFFLFHRLMHTKYFYKRIHKIHHEWKAPIGLISIYAHPTGKQIVDFICGTE